MHFKDYRKVNSMYRKLSLRTCDARWRLQPRPPSQHKPVSAQLLWLPIDNKPALVQVMARRRTGDKHYLNQWYLVHWRIYASKWVKWWIGIRGATTRSFQVIACHLFSAKPLSESMTTKCQLDSGRNFGEIRVKTRKFLYKKLHLTCRLRNDGHFVSASMY